MEIEQVNKIVLLGALILGISFGLASQTSRFCVLGAISDFFLYRNIVRLKMWFLAVLSAIVTTQILILNSIISPYSSMFIGNKILWFSNITGGLCFGFGMALASGCGSKALIRIGEGNLKALVVFITIAFSGLLTLKGILAPLRINFFQEIYILTSQNSDLVSITSTIFGTKNEIRKIFIFLATTFLVLILFFNVFNEKNFKKKLCKNYFLSIMLGVLVTCGWFLTGYIGFLTEHPDTLEMAYVGTNSNSIESFTFVGPISYLSELLMYWTDTSKRLTFGICIILGTVFGSLLSSNFSKTFKLEGFSSSTDFYHHITGGFLMGIGGVIAVGCSIGHGISGMSFLSLSSLITIISICIGAYFGLIYLQKQT